MDLDSKRSEREFQRKLKNMKFITVPASLALGLGMYGVFGANGNAFTPLLNDRNVCYFLLVGGATFQLAGLIYFILLMKNKKNYQN